MIDGVEGLTCAVEGDGGKFFHRFCCLFDDASSVVGWMIGCNHS